MNLPNVVWQPQALEHPPDKISNNSYDIPSLKLCASLIVTSQKGLRFADGSLTCAVSLLQWSKVAGKRRSTPLNQCLSYCNSSRVVLKEAPVMSLREYSPAKPCTRPFELSHFVNIIMVISFSRLLGLPCSDTLSKLLPATLLRLLPGNNSLKSLRKGQYNQSDEVLNHLNDPSCWCPELVFGIIDCAGIAHEASRGR